MVKENLDTCKAYEPIRNGLLGDDFYLPRRRGEKIIFDYSDKASFSCCSCFNWINNAAYSKITPNRINRNTYILRYGAKYGDGNIPEEQRDIFVDNRFFYYIKDLKIISKKDCYIHKFSFTIDSYLNDVPVLVKSQHEMEGKQYFSPWKIKDFEILISHKDFQKRKWLNKKLTSEIFDTLDVLLSKAEDKCSLE